MVKRYDEKPLPLPNPEDWLDAGAAAKIIGTTRNNMQSRASRGRPPRTYLVGGRRMYWRPDVIAFRDAQRLVKPPAAQQLVKPPADHNCTPTCPMYWRPDVIAFRDAQRLVRPTNEPETRGAYLRPDEE